MSGAGSENRTRVTSLEGWGFTTKLHPHFKKKLRTCRGALHT